MKSALYSIALLAFFQAALFLYSTIVTDTSLNSAFFAGGDLVPLSLNLSFTRVGQPTQCNGLYDCTRQICSAYSNSETAFVGIRVWDYWDNNGSSCPFSYSNAMVDAVKYDPKALFYSVLLTMYASIFVELLTFVTMLYCKRFRTVWWSSTVLLLISWVLYMVYIINHERNFGDHMPYYMRSFMIMNAVISLLLAICTKALALYSRVSQYMAL